MRFESSLVIFGCLAVPSAFGQTVRNGTHIIPCASSITLDPSYRAESLDLNCAVTSVSIPAGAGGSSYLLTVTQDGGSVSGVSSMMTGATTPNSTGKTNFYMLWSESAGAWAVSKSPVTIPTALSQLTNDVGFVTSVPSTAGLVTSAQAAAAAPVQSVNGKTGAVTLSATDVGADASGAAATVQTAVTAEATARTSAVNAETSRATAAEGTNATAISAETSSRTSSVTAALATAANASNLTSGTLPATRLPASGVTAGVCGSATIHCIPTFDATGRVTGFTTLALPQPNPLELYWSIQPGLFSLSTTLGPVYLVPSAYTFSTMTVRTSGTIACTTAPTLALVDLGTSPSTSYASATMLASNALGTTKGVVTVTGTYSVAAGHYLGVAFTGGVCVTPPTVDATVW